MPNFISPFFKGLFSFVLLNIQNLIPKEHSIKQTSLKPYAYAYTLTMNSLVLLHLK